MELEDGTVALNPAPTADDDTLATSTFYSQVMLVDFNTKEIIFLLLLYPW